ncbi:MAG: hypothetical protein HY811_00110 [Planctomycetes bacterium]|nr:hypothetical protein [Planctomycetota bacterium]
MKRPAKRQWSPDLIGNELDTYEYLSIHLMGERKLYEKSFEMVKIQVRELKKFRSLNALMAFFSYAKGEDALPRDKAEAFLIKEALFRLDEETPSLRPQIVEVLMIAMWDELAQKYGTHEGFRNSYWDLLLELESRKNSKETI